YPSIIKSVGWGNVAKERRTDPVLASILDNLWDQSKHQPGIYHQQIVDDNGDSPSGLEILEVVKHILRYVKGCGNAALTKDIRTREMAPVDNGLVNAIDNLHAQDGPSPRSQVTMGVTQQPGFPYRHYLWTEIYPSPVRAKKANEFDDGQLQISPAKPNRYWRLVDRRVKVTIAFCRNLRERIKQLSPVDQAKPLEWPLVEVGYSNNCVNRLYEHASHYNSNYLMGLFDAYLTELRSRQPGTIKKAYHIDQTVIFLIFQPWMAELAKIAMIKLAEAYLENGGGFTHYPPGLSNSSAYSVSSLVWSKAEMYVAQNLARNMNRKKELEATE
ncbi:hypothetical protein C7974DRAFT_277240, partial [Boeremia exigua]|uniref:uncharacterized protein n=1 Tax=Boeremia exigua TaxID=749465 RepID=UPI001E8E3629